MSMPERSTPALTRDTTAYRATDLIYYGLVHLSPTLKPKPDLADQLG